MEASILPNQGKARKPPPLGRYTLPAQDWARLDSTPYGGIFAKSSAPAAGDDAHIRMRSQVNFDHYAVPRGRAVLDKEFPKPKRTFHATVRR